MADTLVLGTSPFGGMGSTPFSGTKIMIQTTHVWQVDLEGIDPGIRSALEKKYGSSRSGTIYIVADCFGEAEEIAMTMFLQNGYDPPKRFLNVERSESGNYPSISQTHLVKQALRLVY